jgi:transposase-like protein
MARQRRRFSAEFKARLAIEAIKGQRTLADLAGEHQVHPNQITVAERQQQSLPARPPLLQTHAASGPPRPSAASRPPGKDVERRGRPRDHPAATDATDSIGDSPPQHFKAQRAATALALGHQIV